jgi:hypothetical protein
MIMIRALVLGLFSFSAISAAAENHQMVQLNEVGAKSRLGENCEKFYSHVKASVTGIEFRMHRLDVFSLNNFSKFEIIDTPSSESHSVQCSIEIESRDPKVKLFARWGHNHTIDVPGVRYLFSSMGQELCDDEFMCAQRDTEKFNFLPNIHYRYEEQGHPRLCSVSYLQAVVKE